MSAECSTNLLPGLGIPEADLSILAARRNFLTVRAPRDREHPIPMSAARTMRGLRIQIPEAYSGVARATHEMPSSETHALW